MKAPLPEIKFCGFTRQEDIRVALELGVRTLGINFYQKSKRYVNPTDAVRLLEPFLRARGVGESSTASACFIGVFVDASPEEVLATVQQCSLHGIQLHGNEDPSWVDRIRQLDGWVDVPIWRALPYRGSIDDALIVDWSELVYAEASPVSGLLIDAYDPIHKGGTGKRVAWELLIPRPVSFFPRRVTGASAESSAGIVDSLGVPFLLAGGLTPENVTQALNMVMPVGVDVASGIESEPGVKDKTKMQQFVRAYRACRASEKTLTRGERS